HLDPTRRAHLVFSDDLLCFQAGHSFQAHVSLSFLYQVVQCGLQIALRRSAGLHLTPRRSSLG
ncbi:MAG: hypothetical protein ACK559_34450, partial [bacterium]